MEALERVMPQQASMTAVDWGSSQFRAYLLDGNGDVMEKTENNQGIFTIGNGGFEDVLYSSCNDWFERWPDLPVLICGMAGSREGWVDTAYWQCPITMEALAEHLVPVPEARHHPIFIVPGITSCAFAFTDVMRGEETQVFGLPADVCARGIACLPGTHSKWVSFEGSRIKHFATFLTGELFASIKSSASIEPMLRCQGFDEAAFRDGVRLSRRPGGLLHHAFSIRSHLVAGEAAHGAHASYLSGLLIGAEIHAGMTLFPLQDSIILTGNISLIRQYELAFSLFDVATTCIPSEQAIARGLWNLTVASGRPLQAGKCRYA